MALEDKKLPIEYRSIDTDAYNFYRKKEGGDGLLKFFLFAILAISLFVFVIAVFSTALKEDPEGIAGPLYLVAGIIVSALVLIFAFAMMVSKNKNLTNQNYDKQSVDTNKDKESRKESNKEKDSNIKLHLIT